MRTRLAARILVACMVAGWSLSVGTVSAQSQVPVELSLPELTVEPGETVLVPVSISDVTGLGILSSNLVIGFDPDIVASTRVLYQGTMTEGWSHAERVRFYATESGMTGLMSIGVFTVADPAAGAGPFLFLEITTSEHAQGSSPITFDTAILNNSTPQAIVQHGRLVFRSADTFGDFNADGRVNFSDFLQFAARFGKNSTDPDYEVRFDFNENGQVGFDDFLQFASRFAP